MSNNFIYTPPIEREFDVIVVNIVVVWHTCLYAVDMSLHYFHGLQPFPHIGAI